jgi:S-adenosylmethionine synthetase
VCNISCETSVRLPEKEVYKAVKRIAGDVYVNLRQLPQDGKLADNQCGHIRCGDNGTFRGMPVTHEQMMLSAIARRLFQDYPHDGKYILDGDRLIICQSHADSEDLREQFPGAEINPLGDWTGGTDVDTGATNRKLGSDMADSITGGGLHGKDLSKADVSVNIYAWLKAQRDEVPVELCCAIGDDTVDGRPYAEIVRIARDYIRRIGGFEKFAEWGLV